MPSGQIECSWFEEDLWSLTLEKGYLHDRWRTSAIKHSFLGNARERNYQRYERAKYTSQHTHSAQD